MTCVSYAAQGWGVGEVWFEDDRLVWHELPRPPEPLFYRYTRARAKPPPRVGLTPTTPRGRRYGKRRESRERVRAEIDEFVDSCAYFAGDRVDFDDVAIEVEGWTTFQLDVMLRSAMSRTARSSRTPTSRGSPVIRGHNVPPARSVRTTGSDSSSRATASSARTASARTAHSASPTSNGCSPSKVSLSEDLRNELAAIAPRSDCDRLAELSGLFHTAGSVHLRGRGEVSVHLDVADSGRRAPRVQPAARRSASRRRSGPTAAGHSRARRATSSTSRETSARCRCCTRQASSARGSARSSIRRDASSHAPAAGLPTSAGRCSAAGR